MKQFIKLLAPTILLVICLNASFADCGLRPFKPLAPLGCSDLTAVCSCDYNGDNCHWTWQCIPN